MRKLIFAILLVALTAIATGCGETLSGAGKDVGRMGKGINTFFFRQS
jgi:predicted small secreted protein